MNKHGAGDLYFGVRNDGTVAGQNLCDAAGCQVEYRNEAYGFTVVFSRKRSVTPQDDKMKRLLTFCAKPKTDNFIFMLWELYSKKGDGLYDTVYL